MCVNKSCANRANNILPLINTSVRCAVWIYKSVHTEVSIVRILAKVAAITIHCLAIFSNTLINCVITPLPYEAAAELVIFVHQLHDDLLIVVLDISRTVTHCVNKLTLDKWLLRTFLGKVAVNFLSSSIHTAVKVKHTLIKTFRVIPGRRLIVCKTCWVIFLCPASGILVSIAKASLISERPD